MTKEEELRQLEELRRIQAEEKRKMRMQGMSDYSDSAFSDSAFSDSAFSSGNSYKNDSAFSDSAFSDSAFSDSAFSSNNSAQRPVHNTQQTYIQNPMNIVQHTGVQNPMNAPQYTSIQNPMYTGSQPQYVEQPQHMQQPQHTRQPQQPQYSGQQPQYRQPQEPQHTRQPQYAGQPQDMQSQQRQHRQAGQPQDMQPQRRQPRQTSQPQNMHQQPQHMQQPMQPQYSEQPQGRQRRAMNAAEPTNNNRNKKQNSSKHKDMNQQNMQQNNMQQNNMQKNGKKKKKKHPVLKIVIVLLLIFAILFGTGMFLVVRALNKMERVETVVSKRSDNFHGDVYNILLIGQDAREGEGMQRADTIILCTINKKTHTVTLTSIMRDMYVNIPGYGGNRVNAAFAFGGIDLLDQTIEENLGIKIDGNALVDFGGFMEAMTAVGNLDIELTAEEAAYLNEHPELGTTDEVAVETWNLHEGVNNMTPGQVLGYSRIRHVGNSDWDRTNRQRFVINAVIDKIKHGHLLKGFKVLDGVCPHIMTDMTTKNMLKAGFAYIRCSKGGMNSFYLPAEGTYQATYVDGMAVLLPDIEANKQVLQQYMQGIDPAAQ